MNTDHETREGTMTGDKRSGFHFCLLSFIIIIMIICACVCRHVWDSYDSGRTVSAVDALLPPWALGNLSQMIKFSGGKLFHRIWPEKKKKVLRKSSEKGNKIRKIKGRGMLGV